MKKVLFEDSEIKPVKIIKKVQTDELIDLTLEKKIFKPVNSTEESYAPELTMWYGDSPDLNFKIENLFSELTDDYQRAKARINLGIAGEYALVWGNITGNILQLSDLVLFVKDTIELENGEFLVRLTELLKIWTNEVNAKLNTKANIISPILEGTPTAPTARLSNYSKLLVNTQWVTDKIDEVTNNTIKYFTINPEWGYTVNIPLEVTLSWEYNSNITNLSINGEVLPLEARLKVLQLTEPTDYTLTYTTEDGLSFERTVTCELKDPIYYGTLLSNMTLTTNTSFYINCGNTNYAYVMMPNVDVSFSVNNLVGGFELKEVKVLNGVNYFVYKSYNKGLGNIKLNILYG